MARGQCLSAEMTQRASRRENSAPDGFESGAAWLAGGAATVPVLAVWALAGRSVAAERGALMQRAGRHDFVEGEWPAALKRGVRDQARRFESCLKTFARQAFGRAGPAQLRRSAFVLAEVPIATVKPHLERREPPPMIVDELITRTYQAIVSSGGRSNRGPDASMLKQAPRYGGDH